MLVDDDKDDLDELQSECDPDVDQNAFHIGEPLDPPQARLYSTHELHTLIHEGIIDLSPPYQRDVVWTEPKQMKLLDSIYRNFYVPPVVFAVYIDDEGEEVRMCVDGKQRLTSIQKFFDGQIAYKDPKTGKHFWYTRAESQRTTRLEVPKHWKDEFASKQITCVEYRNLPNGFERDIFQRVQMGMPLTAAEKLQAIASPWADWISVLDSQYISAENGLTTKIDVDVKRGRDFQTLAQLVYCCYLYPEHVVPTAQKMEKWLNEQDTPPAAFKAAITETLREFWSIAEDSKLNFAFRRITKRVAPIEFVFIGVVLYVLRNCDRDTRAQELHAMRTHVRKRFADVRARADVVRCLWEFVEDVVEKYEVDGASGKRKPAGSGKKKRRKAADASNDEDMDFEDISRPQVAKRTRGRPRKSSN